MTEAKDLAGCGSVDRWPTQAVEIGVTHENATAACTGLSFQLYDDEVLFPYPALSPALR